MPSTAMGMNSNDSNIDRAKSYAIWRPLVEFPELVRLAWGPTITTTKTLTEEHGRDRLPCAG